MTRIINFSDMPNDPNDPSGPTIRDVNLQRQHEIAIGAIVDVEFEDETSDGKTWIKYQARMYVVEHTRDCDGTPLYLVAIDPPIPFFYEFKEDWRARCIRNHMFKVHGPFSAQSLTVVSS